MPGQPWTAAAANAAPLTAWCGDCVPPEPKIYNIKIILDVVKSLVKMLCSNHAPVVGVTTPDVSPLIPGRPAAAIAGDK